MQRLFGRREHGKSKELKESQSGWKTESGGGSTMGYETIIG